MPPISVDRPVGFAKQPETKGPSPGSPFDTDVRCVTARSGLKGNTARKERTQAHEARSAGTPSFTCEEPSGREASRPWSSEGTGGGLTGAQYVKLTEKKLPEIAKKALKFANGRPVFWMQDNCAVHLKEDIKKL